MNRKSICGLLTIATLFMALSGWAQENIRAVLDFSDGSRLVGTALEDSLRVATETADHSLITMEVPLAKIRACEINHQDNKITLALQNGDTFKGLVQNPQFRVETLLGRLAPEFRHINRITFGDGNTPAPPIPEPRAPAPDEPIPTITFGGVEWTPWHTCFEVQGDKLTSLPKARPGFNYGHGGSGRGPVLITGLGSIEIRDFTAEFDFCAPGVDPAFNPYSLGNDYHDGAISFHIANGHESWNTPKGGSGYALDVHGDGKWDLRCNYNSYCPAPLGWTQPVNDGARELAKGDGLKIDREKGNHFRIDVIGMHIQIWVDGQKIVDLVDEGMSEAHGGTTIDHGGIGFHGGFDAMCWIRNFSLKRL
jgi:hypothetical protein